MLCLFRMKTHHDFVLLPKIFTMTNNLNAFVLLAFMTSFFYVQPVDASDDLVNWMTIEEAQEAVSEDPRMVFVDVYTDWCGFCRRMNNETYAHPVIANYLNENFYPVKLNAEQEEPIDFRGVTFENENLGERRPAHSFAIALLQGQMSYPSVAFFNEDLELLTAIPGFRPPANMEAVLAFFNEGAYKENNNLDDFIGAFEATIEE